MGVVDALTKRVDYAERQIDNVMAFVTEPRGVFETVDTMIKTFRQANKATLSALKSGMRW